MIIKRDPHTGLASFWDEPSPYLLPSASPSCDVLTSWLCSDKDEGIDPEDGSCPGCGGVWIMGAHFWPEDIEQAEAYIESGSPDPYGIHPSGIKRRSP